MRYGFILPSGDARAAAELAAVAEEHGWDGFFCWDGIWATDVWVSLTAAAMMTERIKLGTMLTPIPRKRPWDLASQTATLDRLSGGRVILSVGLGVSGQDRWWLFEDDPGRKVRAEQLDEGLEMLQHLWRAEPFSYQGKHFQARDAGPIGPPAPAPVQQPRIPIWAVGAWPREKSISRAARLDGLLPAYAPTDKSSGEVTPERLAEAVAWVRERRASEGLTGDYDVIMEGSTEPATGAEKVRAWADAGATWWLECDWSVDEADVREASERRLRQGPPRI